MSLCSGYKDEYLRDWWKWQDGESPSGKRASHRLRLPLFPRVTSTISLEGRVGRTYCNPTRSRPQRREADPVARFRQGLSSPPGLVVPSSTASAGPAAPPDCTFGDAADLCHKAHHIRMKSIVILTQPSRSCPSTRRSELAHSPETPRKFRIWPIVAGRRGSRRRGCR